MEFLSLSRRRSSSRNVPAVKSEEKPLFSQARFLTSYSLELPGCRTNILVPLVSRRWLVIKTFIGIPYVIWRSWVQVVRTMTSCFSLMATPQLQVTPQQVQSRVWIFLKKTTRKKKKIFRYSTNQPQYSIVYTFISYRNVDVIGKIFRKNVKPNVAWVLVPFLSPKKA